MRGSAPVIGAQGSPYLEPDQWQFNFGWRYQYSDRHFTGFSEEEERDHEDSQVKNTIHMLTFGATYGWDEQTAVTITLPYFMNERSQQNRAFPGERRFTAARGIGDLSVLARRWLLDTQENPTHNFGVGLGIKLPTGEDNVQDSIKVIADSDGDGDTEPMLRSQTVDQSIQPGDGGFGLIVDFEWFHQIGSFTPYAYLGWIFTPQGESGVQTGRSKQGERVMSIADNYFARCGTMYALDSLPGLSLGLGGRIEGVPAHDPWGKDHGFRRPGYAVSVEPSVILARGANVFSLSVPIAVVRNRQRSDADQRFGGHGDAAFADYVLLFNWSHRFGGKGS